MNDELYHYGRKGMKWGQRIFTKDKKNSSEAYKSAKTEYSRNNKVAKKYFKYLNKHKNSVDNPYRKKLRESDESLRKSVEKYLDSVGKQKAKDLIGYDIEHGKYFVDNKLFDEKLNYDSFTYISDETARKYRKR